MSRRYYLGVDGGQSSTIALIADEQGVIVGKGQGGPCNHVSGPEARDRFLTVVGGCLREAAVSIDFGSSKPHVAAACFGFSGGAEDKAAFSRELVETPLLKVTHDAEIALTGATEGKPGIIVIAGTGSIAFGRNAGGKTARAGGWGYLFGDEGGAFDIVRQALRAILQYEEGWGPETSLYACLLEVTGAETADELLHRFYAGTNRTAIAELAPLVTREAQAGDPVAISILHDAAAALTSYVAGVHRTLFTDGLRVPVAHVGGVFRSVFLRERFAGRLLETLQCEPTFPSLSPSAGAVLEALRMDGNQSPITQAPEVKT